MSVWPSEFAVNQSDITGTSPIPIIWCIGEKETGKSTLVATIDPVRPGTKTRTKITDLEMSYATIAKQVPLDVVDIRAITRDRIGKDYTFKDLFVTWREEVLNVEPGEFTVLGVDPASDLFQGAFAWVGENASLFGKNAQNYNGTMGTKAQWGDTALYWKQLSLELASRYETIVFVSHLKDLYKDNVRTGRKGARGADFTEVATLVLWLDFTNGVRSAQVMKSRLSWYDWGTPQEDRHYPILRDLLPRKLIPEYSGQSYPELIVKYMAAPQTDYGDLNKVDRDFSEVVQTDEEKQNIRLQTAEAEAQVAIANGRDKMIKTLIAQGYYADAREVARMAKQNDLVYTVATHDQIYSALANLGKQPDA